MLGRKIRKFPTDSALTRMDAGKLPGIVIPVVVGSSPISHPNEFKALHSEGLFSDHCIFQNLEYESKSSSHFAVSRANFREITVSAN